jgi:hypothetical protein
MVRTQVQLPEEIYREAKRIAEQREISLAEVVRRGLEHMARIYPPSKLRAKEWKLPEAHRLGEFRAPADDWRELGNEPVAPRRRGR